MRVVAIGLDKAERKCISWKRALKNLQDLGELTVLTVHCGPDLKRPGHVPTATGGTVPTDHTGTLTEGLMVWPGSNGCSLSSPSAAGGVELKGLRVPSSFPRSPNLGSRSGFRRMLNAFGRRLSSVMQCFVQG